MSEQLMSANFYYHPRLRLTPPPPTIYIDHDTGEMIQITSHWFLEMISSFTDEDLLQYYCKTIGIAGLHPDDQKRFLGALMYLVRRYGLDIVLYTIDIASGSTEDSLESPLDLQAYIYQGMEVLNRQISREKERGMNHVVKRPR
jgi:hypothetical protein